MTKPFILLNTHDQMRGSENAGQFLRVSVGPGKPNLQADVLLVQKLLNANGARLQTEPLELDGVFGPKTAADILAYQALILGIRRPDGVVDPGESTVKSLLHGARQLDDTSSGRPAPDKHPEFASVKPAVRPPDVQAFISFALPAAVQVKRDWHVPISLLIAQAGLSSGWGKHVSGNAYFGIRAKRQTSVAGSFASFEVLEGKRVQLKSSYREYVSFAEAADDYGRFLTESARFRPAFSFKGDPIGFAKTVASLWYPEDAQSASLVVRIIQLYELNQYDS